MRAFPLAVLLLLAIPSAASEDPDLARPLFASAVLYDDKVLVSWSPNAEQADFFNVYGVVNETRHLLESVTDTIAEVAPGFEAYEVTAVNNGTESAPVTALTLAANPPCRIDIHLPAITVGCSPRVAFGVHLEVNDATIL